MSNTVTQINQDHPWNQYKAAKEGLKRRLNSMSNEQLMQTAFVNLGGKMTPRAPRKDLIRLLMDGFEVQFRQAFQDKYGFDLDSTRRPWLYFLSALWYKTKEALSFWRRKV